jgi:acyl carrier protein
LLITGYQENIENNMNLEHQKFYQILSNFTTRTLTPESKLIEDADLDSLDLVELVMTCEDEFQIEIPEDRLIAVSTVNDILLLIDSLVGSN